MKQLTIACSDDLEDRVISVLDAAGAEGFLRISGATGHKFTESTDAHRTLTWSAAVLLVPAVPDECVAKVVAALGAYASSCADEPCLRVTVASLDEVL